MFVFGILKSVVTKPKYIIMIINITSTGLVIGDSHKKQILSEQTFLLGGSRIT
jgi:hypothetical protein